MLKLILTNFFLLLLLKSSVSAAETYIQTSDLDNDSFQKIVSALNGKTLIEHIENSYSIQKNFKFNEDSAIKEIETQIQKIESLPILKGDVEIIIGLYQKIYQQNKKIPAIKVYSYFKTHPDLQEYYPDFWSEIKEKVPERSYIPQRQFQKMLEVLLSDENIYVDGKLLARDEIKKIINIKRQWLFVSNKRKMLFHNGSIEEFTRKIQQTGFYGGNCMHEENLLSSNIELKATLLTNEHQCQQFLPNNQILRSQFKKESYYERNKDWIIPVTIGVGVLALNYLKDKKVTFQLPSIQF